MQNYFLKYFIFFFMHYFSQIFVVQKYLKEMINQCVSLCLEICPPANHYLSDWVPPYGLAIGHWALKSLSPSNLGIELDAGHWTLIWVLNWPLGTELGIELGIGHWTGTLGIELGIGYWTGLGIELGIQSTELGIWTRNWLWTEHYAVLLVS